MENSPVFLHLEESENVTRLLGQSPTCALTVTSGVHLNFPFRPALAVTMCNPPAYTGEAPTVLHAFFGQTKGRSLE